MAVIRIATWNINGLSPNIHELETIIKCNKLDVVLISESHTTSSSSYHIEGFKIYHTPHPDGRAHAGSAVVIKENLKHSVLNAYSTIHLQATTVRLEDRAGPVVLSAVYCPPRHKITEAVFTDFFKTLGPRFVAGGDWNAKHSFWGSRCSVTRGRELKRSVDNNHFQAISTGDPTYWPADPNKIPDLLDFFISKNICHLHTSIESSYDGSSDHTPVILSISASPLTLEKPESLYSYKTDWGGFRAYIEDNINLNVSLKSREDVDEACKYVTNLIQVASWCNTPYQNVMTKTLTLPHEVKVRIEEKRRLRRAWQQSRHPLDKKRLNKAIKELKTVLKQSANAVLKINLENMSPTRNDGHSLWKATKYLNRPQQSFPPLRYLSSWAKTDAEKAEAFANHLASVFKPNDSNLDETELDCTLNQDLQLCLPINPTSPKEIWKEIKQLDPKKAPGFDLISPRLLKELPKKCVTFLACLFNAIFRLSHFPQLWKVSEIVMIHKPGKPAHEAASYRPISLTPVLSKLWERIFLTRLKKHMDEINIIPNHQFGFRKSHSTVEQVHRVYNVVRQGFENKLFCSAAFLDVQQAFDKVWHKGLLYKVKERLPHSLFLIIASYLSDRSFRVKQNDARSSLHPILAGVPQGSVLGPVLYNIFTYDLPTSDEITTATYADDIAHIACHADPVLASSNLQQLLNNTYDWLQKWRIRASAQKSNHITFSLKRGDCPPVQLGTDVLPHSESVKYLGFHLDRRLTWKNHIKCKRDEINHRFKSLYWLMRRNSALSADNKLLIYKSVLKPIWTYGIQLWSVASKTNIACLQRVQNAILREIVNGPWFVRNDEIHEHLGMPTVAEEIERYKKSHAARLAGHPNPLAVHLLDATNNTKRLKRRQVL